ncbi:hypothetical protein Tco_1317349 [Tanacetum coccineum]
MENYKNVSQDIRDQLNAEAEAVQIILTGIDNDIYSTVDACPNACEMWKAIERVETGESINVQDLETNLYWEFGKFTSRDGESLESYYSRFYKMMNELVRNQCHVTNHQVNVLLTSPTTRMATEHHPKADQCDKELKDYHVLLNPLHLFACNNNQFTIIKTIHPQNHNIPHKRKIATVYKKQRKRNCFPLLHPTLCLSRTCNLTEDEAMSKEKEIDKLNGFTFSLFRKSNKPTNNTPSNSLNTSRFNTIKSLKKSIQATGYDNQRGQLKM